MVLLTYVLAVCVALASFALYFVAYFFPVAGRTVHLLWSALGLVYAIGLVWLAPRADLGQWLLLPLGYFATQTIKLRIELDRERGRGDDLQVRLDDTRLKRGG